MTKVMQTLAITLILRSPLNTPHPRSGLIGRTGMAVAWATTRNQRLNNKAKIQEEARFKILRLLHENPELTQRELGERVGVSLGAVNYCLKALIARGLVKAGNFSKSSNKLGYAYVLTPAGISEKALLTGSFLSRKLVEYQALKAEIEVLSSEIARANALGEKQS
jgi:EPS-associated MarR family transcriptional regulator